MNITVKVIYYSFLLIFILSNCTNDKKIPDVFVSFPSTVMYISDSSYKFDYCSIAINKGDSNLITFIKEKNDCNKLVLQNADFEGKKFNLDTLFKVFHGQNISFYMYLTVTRKQSLFDYNYRILIDSLKKKMTLKMRPILD